jgi:hypothetical protein
LDTVLRSASSKRDDIFKIYARCLSLYFISLYQSVYLSMDLSTERDMFVVEVEKANILLSPALTPLLII